MTREEIIEKLRAIGFKENESKVFFVLLDGNTKSASQIAKESHIIRNSIYDILKSFVDKGYCNEIETNTILQYQSIDPVVLIDKIEKEFNELNRWKIKTLKDTFSEVNNFYSTSGKPQVNDDGERNIELIRGFNKHRMEKFIDIYKNAKSSMHGMYRLRGIVSDEINDITESFIKKGGVIKSVYQANLNFKIIKNGTAVPAQKEDLVNVLEKFAGAGEQIRIAEMEIPNMVIFDEEVVFNNINDKDIPKNKQADIIVKNKNNARFMIDLFNYYWNKGLTIEEFKKQNT